MSDNGRILIIDDSETLLARAQARLTAEGFEVQTTTQATGNGRHLRSVDLVIIDFHMPGIDGSVVVDSLRRVASDKSAVLLYLYTSDDAVAARYSAYGFDGAFSAKGDLEALATQVRAAFRLIRMRSAKEKVPALSRGAR
jgi:DNA-binding response OmpR family regulator